MKRRMLGNVNAFENLKKDNFFFIFAMLLVLVAWLIFPIIIFNEIYSNINDAYVSVLTYILYGLVLGYYIHYVLSFIFCRNQLKIRNRLIKFVLFLFYTTFIHIYVLIFTKNIYVILIVNIIYLLFYYLYPYLKYFNQNTSEIYNVNLQKSKKGDYALTVFSLIILIVSIIDYIVFKNILLLSSDVPIAVRLLVFLFIIFAIFPKYSSILWMNLYYRKYALEKDKVYTEEWVSYGVNRAKIKNVEFKNNDITIIYEDGVVAFFDPLWTEMCFYDLDNEKLSSGYNVINENKFFYKIKFDLPFEDEVRIVDLFISKYTNQVLKVAAQKRIFKPNYQQTKLEGYINVFLFLVSFFASNNMMLGMINIPLHIIFVLRLTYLTKWQRYLIKLSLICFYLLIIFYLCLNKIFHIIK